MEMNPNPKCAPSFLAMAHALRKEGYSNGFQSIRSNLLDLNVSENCRCYPGHSGVIILRYTYVQHVCLTAFARKSDPLKEVVKATL
jgi:hypothetical protein